MLHFIAIQIKRAHGLTTASKSTGLIKLGLIALSLNLGACASLTSSTPPEGYNPYGLMMAADAHHRWNQPAPTIGTGQAPMQPVIINQVQPTPACANWPYCTTPVGY